MGVADLYRDRASLGHIPVLKGQTLIEVPYRLQVDANTIGLWNFDAIDKNANPYLIDRAATPHRGTLVNTPTWGTTGPWGSDLGFVMTSTQAVAVADGCNVGSNDMTVEVICKIATIPETAAYDAVYWHGIVGRVPVIGGKRWWYLCVGGHAQAGTDIGKPAFYCLAAGEFTVVGANRVDDGNYHYIAATLNRTTEAADIYVDGVNVGSIADTNIGAGTLDEQTLEFGTNSSAVDSLTGSIATVRISTVARPAAEILTNAKLMGFA